MVLGCSASAILKQCADRKVPNGAWVLGECNTKTVCRPQGSVSGSCMGSSRLSTRLASLCVQALTYFPPEDKPLLDLLCRWTVAFRCCALVAWLLGCMLPRV